jgi:uncharacterized protein DUF6941
VIQRPVAVGLLACETVIVDEQTRMVTPVNCFSRRGFVAFPSEPVSFVVLATLTDGIGEGTLELLIERLDGEAPEEVYQVLQTCRFPGPLNEVRCTVRIRGLSFPAPCHYQVSLLVDGELIAQRRLRLFLEEDTHE